MIFDKKLLSSTSVKLYLLLFIIVLFFVIFFVSYVSHYVGYYRDLYSYRERLVERLTGGGVKKPIYNTGDPFTGNLRSKIIIFEYSDISCPACAAVQPVLEEIKKFYGPNNVAFIWKDLPVNSTNEILTAHQGLHCAFEQGLFEGFKQSLMSNQSDFTLERMKGLITDQGGDAENFDMCLSSNKYKNTVDANFQEALRLGVDSTPTLFVNNKEVLSGFNFLNLRNVIESTK
jgi:protein-disulfide isomerase